MRRSGWIVTAAGAALVAGFAAGLRGRWFPLGVPGEWEWQRIREGPSAIALGLAMLAVAAYSAFVAKGLASLKVHASPRREVGWLVGLVFASVASQAIVQEGAPEGYGLPKWIFSLHAPGSSGYFTVARTQMADPARFLADYPDWIARQDALHVGTHPPGLFLASRAILGVMEASPDLARAVVDFCPPSVARAIKVLREGQGMGRGEGAAIALTGALTLLTCASTVVPLYYLARSTLPSPAAWASAALWPLASSALMFQPTADTAFPLLSTTALALASWAGRLEGRLGVVLAFASGVVMATGMGFTLAFLAVGLVAALVFLASGQTWARRSALIGATGTGFLAATLLGWAVTSANPFVIWWWNQRNHARFYAEYPRSYLAWILVNPIELAVGLGLPATAWIVIGLASPPRETRVTWATLLVLAFLTLSGRSLSEIGRLWLPMMPALLVAAGSGFERLGADPRALAASTAALGAQALVLQSTIQVVYPF